MDFDGRSSSTVAAGSQVILPLNPKARDPRLTPGKLPQPDTSCLCNGRGVANDLRCGHDTELLYTRFMGGSKQKTLAEIECSPAPAC